LFTHKKAHRNARKDAAAITTALIHGQTCSITGEHCISMGIDGVSAVAGRFQIGQLPDKDTEKKPAPACDIGAVETRPLNAVNMPP
jgi:hypothetical protein